MSFFSSYLYFFQSWCGGIGSQGIRLAEALGSTMHDLSMNPRCWTDMMSLDGTSDETFFRAFVGLALIYHSHFA
jgi:hypothetical protein